MLRALLSLAATLFIASALGLLYHWTPHRVVERQLDGLLHAVETKNWKKADAILAADYQDDWHSSRGETIAQLRELFRHFFWLEIRPVEATLTRQPTGDFLWQGRFTFDGSGTAMTSIILQEANQWPGTLILHFRKASFWPWDWRLQTIRQAPPAAS